MADSQPTQSSAAIPGPDTGACPSCGGWIQAGVAHRCAPPGDASGYVFPTWRAALSHAQQRITDAYEHRARLFRKAHEAGLSYREIGEAAGLSAAAVGKVLGKQQRATLDDQANA